MAEDTDSLEPITFWEMLNSAARIVIPVIQRDYAQGRTTTQAKNIRAAFAKALDAAFREAKPLCLDFVYLVSNKDEEMIPVDGQQRLTTLFLFHLYHLPLSEEVKERLDRFVYEVRESAMAFCKALVSSREAWREATQNGQTPQEAIRDQPWFLAAWEHDPTVMGMLRMLDAIHEACKGQVLPDTDNWWERKSVTLLRFKTSNDNPDETYRKLNARGKPLTPFENLKAYIDGKQVPDWANKIDAEWLDAIWALYPCDTNPNPAVPCDTALLSVTLALLLAHQVATAKPNLIARLAAHAQTIFNVITKQATLPNDEREWLCGDGTWKQFLVDGFTRVTDTENAIDWMTAPWEDEFPLAEKLANSSLTYSDLALLYAYLIKPEKHDDWKRVIHNIVENATIDSAETFVSAVRAFKKLAEGDLREALNGASFAQEQCEEEATKLDLVKNNAWREPIEEAEKLPWQKGRILFLLDQSKNGDTHDLKTFESVMDDFKKKFSSRNETWLRQVIANVEAAKRDSVWIPCYMVKDDDSLKAFLYWNDAQTKAAITDSQADTVQSIWLQNLEVANPNWQDHSVRTYGNGVYLYTTKNIRSSYRIDAAVSWWYKLKECLSTDWVTLDSGAWVQAKYGNYEVALLENGIQLKEGENKWGEEKKVPETVRNDPEKLNAWLNGVVSDLAREDTPEDGQ